MNLNESQGVVVQVLPFCLNRQTAIAFSGFKPAYFDEHVRPQLSELRAGTSVLYLREELEGFIRKKFHADQGSESETHQSTAESHIKKAQTGHKKWEERQAASTKPPTVAGKSTSTSTAYDFASALKALKTRKAG